MIRDLSLIEAEFRWVGTKSLNCLPTSLRVAAGALTNCADGIFGGLIGPVSPLADRNALAQLCWNYIETVYGADCVSPLWSNQTITSARDLSALVRHRLGGATIIAVKSRDFEGYPYWHGSEDPKESHTVYIRTLENGPADVIEFLDGALSNRKTVFHVATCSNLSGYIRLPCEVEFYDVNILIKRGQKLGQELIQRKRNFALQAISQALVSLTEPELAPNIHTRDDIVNYLTVSGRPAMLRMLELALSDGNLWPAATAATVTAPINSGHVVSDRIAVLLLRKLSSDREHQSFASLSQMLSQHLTVAYNNLHRMF